MPSHEIKELASEASQWGKWKSVRPPLFSKYSASILERTSLIGANWQPTSVGYYLTQNLGFVLDAFWEPSFKVNSLVNLIHQQKKRSELTCRRKGVFSQSSQLCVLKVLYFDWSQPQWHCGWGSQLSVRNNLTQPHEQSLYFIVEYWLIAELRRPEGPPSGAPYSYRKEMEIHELIFLWWSWLAALLVGAYARRRRRRSRGTWRPYTK